MESSGRLLNDIKDHIDHHSGKALLDVWMSHGDKVTVLPPVLRCWSSRCANCSRTRCAKSASNWACRTTWSTVILSPALARERLLTEITPDDLRALCMKVKKRGAPATAIHVRDIVTQVYAHAIMHGEKVANPADEVMPSSIAIFAPKDRALSPSEIRLMVHEMDTIPTSPTIRLGLRMILVRKTELAYGETLTYCYARSMLNESHRKDKSAISPRF